MTSKWVKSLGVLTWAKCREFLYGEPARDVDGYITIWEDRFEDLTDYMVDLDGSTVLVYQEDGVVVVKLLPPNLNDATMERRYGAALSSLLGRKVRKKAGAWYLDGERLFSGLEIPR